ncbi:cytochrome P450 [Amycolatopsis sp. cg5]|uniref:cytochrome P450 n=1 Tax=Amycolatopsis sp. cg5 TaxID=3238802 RepID=UPI0035234B2B
MPLLDFTSTDMYPALDRLRTEEPVHWSPELNSWAITRYANIAAALRDPRLGSGSMTELIDRLPEADRLRLKPLRDSINLWMGGTDPTAHKRMQRVIKRYFMSRELMAALRPRVQEITDELLDELIPRGGCEIVDDLAYPLPARVMAEMLGIPEKDRDLLPRWSRDITAVFSQIDVPKLLESQQSIVEMSDYLREVVADRRRQPREDLISLLVAAHDKGDIVSEDEILANCVLLLFAGHETTGGLISAGLNLLLRHPDQLKALRADMTLLPGAIEEMLRVDGPASLTTRFSKEPVVIHGQEIDADQHLYLVLAAANRDPEYFDDPTRFDITRTGNRHLSFGQGLRYCLGATLARLEAEICFTSLFDRVDEITPHPDGATRERRGPFVSAVTAVPVTFG